MSETEPEPTVSPPPHRLLTMGAAGLYPPATEGVGGPTGHSGGMPLPDNRAGKVSSPVLGPGKPLALVAFLALSPGRSASREFLLDLLWADMDGERGRHALRQTIWQIRQLLGDASFEGREEIRLTLPIDSDRDRFLAAVEHGNLADAVALYTGPFLPAFAAPGGAEFEHWADREREHLRGLFLRAADTLARRHLAQGRPREALKLARRIREADPLHEGGWRLLLEALTAAHDPVQALVEADALEELLRVEEREAEPATRAALRAARQAPDPESGATSGTSLVAELVGREEEFSRLTHAWDQARLGPSAQILITAPAGLGKSRLLHDFHARLKTLGARTVLVRANPGERDLPCALAADLAGALGQLPGASAVPPAAAATLVALNPVLSARFSTTPLPAEPSDQILQRGIALAELVNAVAYEAPIAILVDDLHWADPQSARLLHALQARITTSRALVVFASRHDRDRSAVQPTTTVLPLRPLDREEIEALLASLGRLTAGEDTEALVSTLARSTAGSPLHVLDALHQAIEHEHLILDDGRWTIRDREGLVQEIERGGSIEGRLRALDQPSFWLMALLATAGAPCSAALLARAAAREGEAITSGLALLEQRGFASRIGTEWEPAHDEIAQTALDIADDTTRRAAARALGEALALMAPSDDMVLRRAMQLLLAGGGTEKIASLLSRTKPALAKTTGYREQVTRVAELLGREEDDADVLAVVSGLPQRRRRSWLAAAAMLVIVLAGAALAVTRPNGDTELPTLYAWLQEEGKPSEVRRVVVRAEEWNSRSSLQAAPTRIELPAGQHTLASTMLTVRGREWVLYHSPSVDNVRTHEVARTDRRGTTYLTDMERDDGFGSLSPDRHQIVFVTARWSPRGEDYSDLAIMDSLGGAVRALTSSPAVETFPKWDHSGTRIAFIRRYREIRPSEVCVITTEGAPIACHPLPGGELDNLIGWTDPTTLLVMSSSPGRSAVLRLDLSTGEYTEFHPRGGVDFNSVSPDGRWLACHCLGRNGEAATLRIISTRDPADSRTVELPSVARLVDVAWNTPAANESALQRIEVTGLPERLARDVSHLPTLRGWNGRGEPTMIPRGVVRWWTTDTLIVKVDSASGQITPLADGSATVRFTAGGWRSGTITVTVAGTSFTSQLTESWESFDSVRWRSYGEPVPRLGRGPGGTLGLIPNGDGSYPSGAYSLAAWPSAEGLGVEALISAPVDRTIWQTVGLTLSRVDAYTALDQWDHTTGSPPFRADLGSPICSFAVPAGEGAVWLEQASVTVDREHQPLPAPTGYRDGRWWTVRIQLFPDGSCGYAIDGVPIARSGPGSGLVRPYRLRLHGHAVGTEPMVGPLEVWTGVKPGVDWGVLDR